jgi:hypothetical protein
MRVLICGSRTWESKVAVEAILDGLLVRCVTRDQHLVVIEGCAKGADSFAHNYDRDNVVHEHYPADWNRHGKAAGPIRNAQMLKEGDPELVVAFSEQPITPGTRHMIKIAKEAGVAVWVIGHG